MAETYDLYFDSGDGLDLIESGLTATELTITFGPFGYATEYSWRVDAINDFGTTTGDTWTFTSIEFAPVLPTGKTMVDGKPASGTTGTPTGENNMMTTKRFMAIAGNKVWYENL